MYTIVATNDIGSRAACNEYPYSFEVDLAKLYISKVLQALRFTRAMPLLMLSMDGYIKNHENRVNGF